MAHKIRFKASWSEEVTTIEAENLAILPWGVAYTHKLESGKRITRFLPAQGFVLLEWDEQLFTSFSPAGPVIPQ